MIEPLDFAEGQFLLIDKPFEWTSFDVVKKIRNSLRIKKIGHAGTLDPLATGLLILCTGKMTKQIDSYQAMEKEYTGTLVLGKTTPSIDLETDFDSETDISHLLEDEIFAASKKFLGKIEQIPPIYSAIKVDGKRLYMHARKGEVVEIQPRKVNIIEFSLTKVALPEIKFKVICSKGTYIRSLVRDFGEVLRVGAYMSKLKRTRIGEFKLENADQLDQFIVKNKAT